MGKLKLSRPGKGTQGQRPEQRTGVAGSSAAASAAQTRSSGPPAQPKPRKAAAPSSEQKRLEMARTVLAESRAKSAATRADRVAARRGMTEKPTGAAADDAADGAAATEVAPDGPAETQGVAASASGDDPADRAADGEVGCPQGLNQAPRAPAAAPTAVCLSL